MLAGGSIDFLLLIQRDPLVSELGGASEGPGPYLYMQWESPLQDAPSVQHPLEDSLGMSRLLWKSEDFTRSSLASQHWLLSSKLNTPVPSVDYGPQSQETTQPVV